MSNNDFDPAQTRVDLWIIGHAGHGKTTLAAAIDRATQARRCVEIGDAPTPPERIKAAILVVSAAEGPMPQTRDHLKIARQAGVPVVVVFLNKIDAADKSLTPLVEMEIRELMTMCGYSGEKAAVIRGSASLALEGDESDAGVPSIQKLLGALGEGRAIVAQNSAAEPDSSVSRSGGWGESLRRFFSR